MNLQLNSDIITLGSSLFCSSVLHYIIMIQTGSLENPDLCVLITMQINFERLKAKVATLTTGSNTLRGLEIKDLFF